MSQTLNKIMTTVYPDFWADFEKEWEDPIRRNLMIKTTDSVVGMISQRAVQVSANSDFSRLLGICDLERKTLEQKVQQEFKDGSESRRLSSSSAGQGDSVNSVPFGVANAGTPPAPSSSPNKGEGIQATPVSFEQPAIQSFHQGGTPSEPIPIPSGDTQSTT